MIRHIDKARLKRIESFIQSFIALYCLFFAAFAHGGWQPPEDVYPPSGEAPSSDSLSYPRMAVDSHGNITVLLSVTHTLNSPLYSRTKLYGGSWGDVLLIAPNASQYSIVVDADGDATAIWNENGAGTYGPIQSATKSLSSNAWEPSGSLSNNGLNPVMAIDFAGNVTVAWESFDDQEYMSSTMVHGTHNWSSPIPISQTSQGTPNNNIAIAIDSSGKATVVFTVHIGPTTFLRSATSPLGPLGHTEWQPFSDPLYETSLGIPENGGVAIIDFSGNATAVWVEVVYESHNVLMASTQIDGVWQSFVTIGSSLPPAVFYSPGLVVDPFGNVTVVCSSSTSGSITSSVTYSSMKPYRGTWQPLEPLPSPAPLEMPIPYCLTSDSAGNLTAVLSSVDIDTMIGFVTVSKKPYGSTWQSPERVSSSNDPFSYPTQAAVYPDGKSIALLLTTQTAGARIQTVTDESLPLVTAISPTNGPPGGGTEVTITGEHFDGAIGVLFGSTNASTFTLISSTTIQAPAPAGDGTVDVRVIAPQGTSMISERDQFSYTLPAPRPPSHCKGHITKRRGSHLKRPYLLQATWRPSRSSNVARYRVYKRSKVVKTIRTDAKRLFHCHLRWKSSIKKISIVAVSSDNIESSHQKLKVSH